MAVTETTKVSWGSRLGASIKVILAGLALFVVGFPVLFWNEGNSVKTAKALEAEEKKAQPEAEKKQEIEADKGAETAGPQN